MPTTDHIAALLVSAALLSLVGAGFAVVIGERTLASRLGGTTIVLVVLSLVVRLLAGWWSRIGATPFSSTDAGGGLDSLTISPLVALMLIGHLVLAVALLARRIWPSAAEDRARARDRDRLRERVRVGVRHDEVEDAGVPGSSQDWTAPPPPGGGR